MGLNLNEKNKLTKIKEDNDLPIVNQYLNAHEENDKIDKLNASGQINTQNNLIKNHNDEYEPTHFYTKDAESGNVKAQKYLAKKYILENDTENIYIYFRMLIKSGNYEIPLKYAKKLFDLKYYKQAFNYFSLIAKSNHPIANYFIGIMKFQGLGCSKNKDESYEIIKYLSDNGIEQATKFLENNNFN